jgi:hypothetical protein
MAGPRRPRDQTFREIDRLGKITIIPGEAPLKDETDAPESILSQL